MLVSQARRPVPPRFLRDAPDFRLPELRRPPLCGFNLRLPDPPPTEIEMASVTGSDPVGGGHTEGAHIGAVSCGGFHIGGVHPPTDSGAISRGTSEPSDRTTARATARALRRCAEGDSSGSADSASTITVLKGAGPLSSGPSHSQSQLHSLDIGPPFFHSRLSDSLARRSFHAPPTSDSRTVTLQSQRNPNDSTTVHQK